MTYGAAKSCLAWHLIQKGGKSGCCSHGPVENRVDRTTDQARFVELGRVSHDRVQQLQHVLIAAHLGFAGWILVVERLFGNLLKHLVKQHADLSIVLDEILKLRNYGM